jgi:hypothetical protein
MLLTWSFTLAVKQKPLLNEQDLEHTRAIAFLRHLPGGYEISFYGSGCISSSVQQVRSSGALFKHRMAFESYVPHCKAVY